MPLEYTYSEEACLVCFDYWYCLAQVLRRASKQMSCQYRTAVKPVQAVNLYYLVTVLNKTGRLIQVYRKVDTAQFYLKQSPDADTWQGAPYGSCQLHDQSMAHVREQCIS